VGAGVTATGGDVRRTAGVGITVTRSQFGIVPQLSEMLFQQLEHRIDFMLTLLHHHQPIQVHIDIIFVQNHRQQLAKVIYQNNELDQLWN
jgi:hypothetical protein